VVAAVLAGLIAGVAGITRTVAAVAEDANALIREGLELRRQGDDVAALQRFQQAYELEHGARPLAQMGLAEQALGRWVVASEHLRDAMEETSDAWIKKNLLVLREAARRVDEHVGRIEILGGTAGAELRIDGVARGKLPLARPLTVSTGTLVIELSAPGYLPIQRTTVVRPREMTRESFDSLVPVAEHPAPPAAKPVAELGREPDSALSVSSAAGGERERSSRRRIITWSVGGLAAASLATAVVSHMVWQSTVSTFDGMSSCDASLPARGGGDCQQLYDEGHRAKIIAYVGYGAAGALAATTAILLLTEPARGSRATGQVACAVNPIAAGVGCALRF
jgi:hypothetical protein